MGHLNARDLRKLFAAREYSVFWYGERTFVRRLRWREDDANSLPKNSQRKTGVLDLMHTDICGPMRENSLPSSKCFLIFVDDS